MLATHIPRLRRLRIQSRRRRASGRVLRRHWTERLCRYRTEIRCRSLRKFYINLFPYRDLRDYVCVIAKSLFRVRGVLFWRFQLKISTILNTSSGGVGWELFEALHGWWIRFAVPDEYFAHAAVDTIFDFGKGGDGRPAWVTWLIVACSIDTLEWCDRYHEDGKTALNGFPEEIPWSIDGKNMHGWWE